MRKYGARMERENRMRKLYDVGVVTREYDDTAVVEHICVDHPICI